MPFNFRLNLNSVFRRLGIQSGARLPQLDDNVQMVMIVTDLSRLVPAPIEPRGLAGANVVTFGANFPMVQLRALSAGGIFVEEMILRGSAPALTENLILDVNVVDEGLPAATQINIGGTPVLSRFTAGSVLAPTVGVTVPAVDGLSRDSFPLGIFVPNQLFFSARTSLPNNVLDIAIVYRELPSVEEVG